MTSQPAAACTEVPRAEQIARLNDLLRKTGTGGTVVITRGVKHLTEFDGATLAEAIAAYDEFDAEGDPHGERDFGCTTLFGADAIWKIDYFSDGTLTFGSDDPADPAISTRVLTIMLAPEW